MPPGRILL